MPRDVVMYTELPGLKEPRRGKVRDIYDLGEHLLIVATDRISAFDCILPAGIPDKGHVLTALSEYWFDMTADISNNHLVTAYVEHMGRELEQHASVIAGRSMLVHKTQPMPVECVVRGYLAGSGWREYQESGTVCGIKLPGGLQKSSKLPEPIFTPATKAESGHDINISFEQMAEIVGDDVAEELRERSIGIYTKAAKHALTHNLIIADTKFEWSTHHDEIILIDEVLTPDSSRFWDANDYKPGASQNSFDKQDVRDWLEASGWDKTPPAPQLPEEVINRARDQYREVLRRITGTTLD